MLYTFLNNIFISISCTYITCIVYIYIELTSIVFKKENVTDTNVRYDARDRARDSYAEAKLCATTHAVCGRSIAPSPACFSAETVYGERRARFYYIFICKDVLCRAVHVCVAKYLLGGVCRLQIYLFRICVRASACEDSRHCEIKMKIFAATTAAATFVHVKMVSLRQFINTKRAKWLSCFVLFIL